MSKDTPKKETTMDSLTASLIVLGAQITSTVIKNCDPALKAPSVEDVTTQLAAFKQLPTLPENYDAGFVEEALDAVQTLVTKYFK